MLLVDAGIFRAVFLYGRAEYVYQVDGRREH